MRRQNGMGQFTGIWIVGAILTGGCSTAQRSNSTASSVARYPASSTLVCRVMVKPSINWDPDLGMKIETANRYNKGVDGKRPGTLVDLRVSRYSDLLWHPQYFSLNPDGLGRGEGSKKPSYSYVMLSRKYKDNSIVVDVGYSRFKADSNGQIVKPEQLWFFIGVPRKVGDPDPKENDRLHELYKLGSERLNNTSLLRDKVYEQWAEVALPYPVVSGFELPIPVKKTGFEQATLNCDFGPQPDTADEI